MNLKQDLRFERFRLDRQNQELRRDSDLIALRPKTFAVLQYLAENPVRLITQEELLKGVWGQTVVSDGLLRGYIRDLRQALSDDASNPRFIETVPRRGFRFLPKVVVESVSQIAAEFDPSATTAAPALVGRDSDLSSLHRLLGAALGGKRQMVFIAGEAGIGKTALLNAFLEQVSAAGSVYSACGQCLEQFGTREAYLPIFDALRVLCRGARANEVVATLSRNAPTWLGQMAGILSDDQLLALQKTGRADTQGRMLSEFCEALESLTAIQPIVLGLEDLQWSDTSTLDLLSLIARRRERARLMVIGTYRPADVIVSGHPLRRVIQDLQAHQLSHEIWPDLLNQPSVTKYLSDRFPGHAFPSTLGQLIHRNTAGNPLFVTAFVDDLLHDQSVGKEAGGWRLRIPVEDLSARQSRSLHQAIEAQLVRLSPAEQRVLEAAALVGAEFTADLPAAALETSIARVEDDCDELVRRGQVLHSAAYDSPTDSTAVSRYGFSHDLYRRVALDRSPPNQRRRWYQRIAEKIVADSGDRSHEAATALAFYFEHANLPLEAAEYCALAGERAMRNLADSESSIQFRRGIDLLERIPASARRGALELRLKVGLAQQLSKTQGFKSREIDVLIDRTVNLTHEVPDAAEVFGPMCLLQSLLNARCQHREAYKLCEKLDRIAEKNGDPILTAEAFRVRGETALNLGHCSEARDSFEQTIATHRREDRKGHPFAFTTNPEAEVAAWSVLSNVLWMNGYPDQAVQRAEEGCAIAKRSGNLYATAMAQFFLNNLMHFLRDVPATLKQTESTIAFCSKHGFTLWLGQAHLLHGWAVAMRGSVEEGIKEQETAFANGVIVGGGSIARLVDAYLRARKTNRGLLAVERGLRFTREHEQSGWEPDLHRLKGELLLQRANAMGGKHLDDIDLAERCFLNAIERARNNDAKSYELRAAMSLYRLWSKQGKRRDARRILAEVYGWFTEGKNTPDLVDARRLLNKART